MKKTAITIGDPAGIGPEIILKSLNELRDNLSDYLLIGSIGIFQRTAEILGLTLLKNVEIIDIPADISNIKTGQYTAHTGEVSYKSLIRACELVEQNKINSIVTAPVSKKAMNMAGYNFVGQTEVMKDYFATYKDGINIYDPEMLFVANDFKVMLLTRHVELKNIVENLSINGVVQSVLKLNNTLLNNFRLNTPKIAMCGLNPHAGEDGILGREELDILIPAIEILKSKYGVNIEGPFPGDTLWYNACRPYFMNQPLPYDAYVACYHDQGLIPIKTIALESTVNTSINLPVIRTSPSHGTAFNIADKYIAKHHSMKEAILLGAKIAKGSDLFVGYY